VLLSLVYEQGCLDLNILLRRLRAYILQLLRRKGPNTGGRSSGHNRMAPLNRPGKESYFGRLLLANFRYPVYLLANLNSGHAHSHLLEHQKVARKF
jgi:hypothetical protein